MKKLIALLLVVLLAASAFVACNKKKDSDDDALPEIEDGAELLVWCPDKAVDLTRELCEEFKKEHSDKDITITVQVMGEDMATTQACGDLEAAADVFGFASDQMSKLLKKDALAPVFDVDDAFTLDEVKDRNSEDSVAAATAEDGNGDEQLYAFPETGDNGYYLVYDKSIMGDEDVKTLEGVLAACKKNNRQFVLDAGNGFYNCMFLFTGGLKLDGLDSDGKQQFNDYDEDEVIKTLKAFSDLFAKYSDTFLPGEDTRIGSGMAETPRSVGAGIDGPWNSAAVKEALGDDFAAVKLPTITVDGEEKQIISMHGFKYIGVKSNTKYPYAAMALADYLTNEQSQLKRAEALGWGPSNIEAAKDKIVTESPVMNAIFEQSQHSVPQVNIATAFWGPLPGLGNFIAKQNGSYDEIKEQFDDCIDLMKEG